MRVGVLGAGSWGTTLAALAAARSNTVLWAYEAEVVEAVRLHRENRSFLPGFKLPGTVEATSDMEEALADADLVVVAVPSQYLRDAVWTHSPPTRPAQRQ